MQEDKMQFVQKISDNQDEDEGEGFRGGEEVGVSKFNSERIGVGNFSRFTGRSKWRPKS